MLANNNLKVCRTLVMRDLKRHRGKNALLILAAAAVAALYTFVFLLGSSVEAAYLLNYRYASGFTDHIRYTGLTDRQADAVEGDFRVKRAVRTTVLGYGPGHRRADRKADRFKPALRRVGALGSDNGKAAGKEGGDRAGRIYAGLAWYRP